MRGQGGLNIGHQGSAVGMCPSGCPSFAHPTTDRVPCYRKRVSVHNPHTSLLQSTFDLTFGFFRWPGIGLICT